MITEIYEFWFFGPKMAVSWRTSAFQKKGPETPIFIVFFGCALSGPRCQRREILKSQQEKWKNLTDNWKANFWYFCCFFWGFFFLVFFLFLCFFGGFKGQVRWPEGPPHLALNPPFFFVLCFVFLLVFFARRATSLGPKPSLFVFVVFCFVFLAFC